MQKQAIKLLPLKRTECWVYSMTFHHIPIMKEACIEGLAINPSGIYIDGTLGGGGHAQAILEQLKTGRLIGIDRDFAAIRAASQRLASFSQNFVAYKRNYREIPDVIREEGLAGVDGILLDLGVSSHQLDTPERGFSFHEDAPLDMRMNQSDQLTASDVVNTYSENALYTIIKDYGEERWAKRIAQFIINERAIKPLETTFDLVRVIKQAIPKKVRVDGGHPARKTFQAIRIEVNGELDALNETIINLVGVLKPKGRLAIITFHSLEDRIVKHTFKELAKDCICPPEFPICTCQHRSVVKVVNRKPIVPTESEIANNPRARSAKLRICQKI